MQPAIYTRTAGTMVPAVLVYSNPFTSLSGDFFVIVVVNGFYTCRRNISHTRRL